MPSINDAEELQEAIPNSICIHSKTNKKIREQYLEDFKNGKYKILINSECLLAGYDHPSLKNLIDAYPSNSIRIKTQKDGRLVRLDDGKDVGRLIDFVGNYRRLGDIRELNYEFIEGYGWGLFKKDILITDVPSNSNNIYTKEYLKNGGKVNLDYVFGEHNKGTAKMTVGKFKNKQLKYLYFRKRFYLKWLIETNYTFKEEDKEFERQLKMIYQ